MESVSVRELKNNPSAALRQARDGEMVVVTNRDTPEAVLIGLAQLGMPDVGRLRLAIAASLFRDGVISSGAAARMAGKSLSEMLDLLARLGIALTPDGGEIADDVAAIDAWLSQASAAR